MDHPPYEQSAPRLHLFPSVVTTVAVTSWYFSNIGVLLLNIYGFRYPIFLTMLHMVACSIYSYLTIRFLGIVPFQQILSRRQFLKIFGLSAIFCFSVVCGNTSLWHILVSFNQAIGAATSFVTAIFAFLITCKKETAEVNLALLPSCSETASRCFTCLGSWVRAGGGPEDAVLAGESAMTVRRKEEASGTEGKENGTKGLELDEVAGQFRDEKTRFLWQTDYL